MQMAHRLAALWPGTDHEAVARLQFFISSNVGSGDDHAPDQMRVTRVKLGQRDDVSNRHNQNVRWRLWCDVVKGDQAIVTIDDSSRSLTRHDLAEDA